MTAAGVLFVATLVIVAGSYLGSYAIARFVFDV
jgi:hypothetical protein